MRSGPRGPVDNGRRRSAISVRLGCVNRPRRVLVVLVGLVALVALVASLALVALRLGAVATRGTPTGGPRAEPVSATTDALLVLRDWDERRADAYAAGSTDRLRDLYVPGAGTADLRMLRDYRSRGLRVVGMRTQLLSVAVLERHPARWTVRVTDRLDGAVAVHGDQRTPLPHDTSSIHLLTLVRSAAGRWRVAGVEAAAR
jgi:hypothetical protein